MKQLKRILSVCMAVIYLIFTSGIGTLYAAGGVCGCAKSGNSKCCCTDKKETDTKLCCGTDKEVLRTISTKSGCCSKKSHSQAKGDNYLVSKYKDGKNSPCCSDKESGSSEIHGCETSRIADGESLRTKSELSQEPSAECVVDKGNSTCHISETQSAGSGIDKGNCTCQISEIPDNSHEGSKEHTLPPNSNEKDEVASFAILNTLAISIAEMVTSVEYAVDTSPPHIESIYCSLLSLRAPPHGSIG